MSKRGNKLASSRKEGLPDAVRSFIEAQYSWIQIDNMVAGAAINDRSDTMLAASITVLADIDSKDFDLAQRLSVKFGHGQIAFVGGALKDLLCDRMLAGVLPQPVATPFSSESSYCTLEAVS